MPTKVPFVQLHGASGRFTSRNQGVLWVGLDVVANNINKRGTTLNESRKKAVERLAKEMQAYAQRNAPWNDRTGDARDRLVAVPIHNDRRQESTVALAHGVGYGLWLEIMQGGRFAILMPTVQAFSTKVISTVREIDSVEAALERVYG